MRDKLAAAKDLISCGWTVEEVGRLLEPWLKKRPGFIARVLRAQQPAPQPDLLGELNDKRREALRAAGVRTDADVVRLGADGLVALKIPGLGPDRARKLVLMSQWAIDRPHE